MGTAALALYAATLAQNFALAHDSVSYLIEIERGAVDGLFHPHHLLYNALAALWLGGLRALGLGADGGLLVALLNAIFGAAGIAVVYAFLRRRAALPLGLALAATALVACSFGYWFYSVSVEVYLIPLFFLLAALYVPMGGGSRPGGSRWSGCCTGWR